MFTIFEQFNAIKAILVWKLITIFMGIPETIIRITIL